MAEIKIDSKATEYLKDKIGGGGSGQPIHQYTMLIDPTYSMCYTCNPVITFVTTKEYNENNMTARDFLIELLGDKKVPVAGEIGYSDYSNAGLLFVGTEGQEEGCLCIMTGDSVFDDNPTTFQIEEINTEHPEYNFLAQVYIVDTIVNPTE